MAEAFLERLRSHPQMNRRLFVFHDLNDQEVNHCYKKADAVIFPSFVEGFGLPIIEALWHKKKTFVSDTTIHREVGKEDCEYFDPYDVQSLCQMLSRWENQPFEGDNVVQRIPLTWEQSVNQLISNVLASIPAAHVRKNKAA